MARNLVIGGAAVAVLVVLWVIPLIFFSNPGTNDAIWLSNLEFLLVLVGWVVAIVAVVRSGARRGAVSGELGVFEVVAAAGLVLGLVVFGNMSDDRFLPLIFVPPLIAAPGLLLIVVGLLATTNRRELLRPAIYGAAAGLLVAAWILARGSRDWLLAPYGFDELAVIVVGAAALVALRPARHG